jgi:hypothetical protein
MSERFGEGPGFYVLHSAFDSAEGQTVPPTTTFFTLTEISKAM